MKLSPGKLQSWEWKSPLHGAGTFFPFSMLVFYIPPCRRFLPAWRNVKIPMTLAIAGFYIHSSIPEMSEEILICNILYSHASYCGLGVSYRISIPKMSLDLPCSPSFFFHIINLRKIPEMSSGMEECKIPAWAREKMFSYPDLWSGAIRSEWWNPD